MTNYSTVTSSKFLHNQIASLLLYQSVLKDEVGQSFLALLQTLNSNKGDFKLQAFTAINCLQAYGNWFKSLAARNQSWCDYLEEQILYDDNPFSQQVQKVSLTNLPRSLIDAAKHDLNILQNLYECSPQQISQWVKTATQNSVTPIAWEITPVSKFFLHWQKKSRNCESYLKNLLSL